MSIRERVATGLAILAQRISGEPRYTDSSRVSTSSRTLAGVNITPDTALKSAAVWAADRYLSQTVAVLPWHAMKDDAKGAEIQSRHPIDWLIYKRPNPEWSSFQLREQLVSWALRWGNGYAEIERDMVGRPVALWPVHPDRVQVCREETGELYYEVNNGAGPKSELAPMDMFHIRYRGEGSPVGISAMHYAAQSIGWAQAAQLFGASFFGNGAVPSVIVRNKKALTPDGLKAQKAEFSQLYKGPYKANKTAHVDNDTEVSVLGLDADKTQLIEVHQFLIEEICRWMGCPPHKVMHLLRAHFNNIEHQAIEAVVDCITPWVKRFEDEADHKLFGQNRSSLYTKMNMRALLRGDAAARIAYYDGMVKIGAYSPNDVLEHEDENTIGPQGDIHVMQSQNVTLETIKKGPPEPVKPAPKPVASPAQARLAAKALVHV